MTNNKITNKKIKKNTILSVFDNIQDKPITLLKWIKSIYKNCKIDHIDVQESNVGKNELGLILVFYFLDGSYLQTPLIRVATQEVIEQIIEAIHEETNARELADSELQHDIDNHTTNTSNPHKTTFNNLLDVPNLITRVEQVDNSLYLYYVGVDTPFIYTPNLAQGVAWGNITGLLADQTDLAQVLQGLQDKLYLNILIFRDTRTPNMVFHLHIITSNNVEHTPTLSEFKNIIQQYGECIINGWVVNNSNGYQIFGIHQTDDNINILYIVDGEITGLEIPNANIELPFINVRQIL